MRSLHNPRSHIYAKFQGNVFTFDTQNTYLKRPCFGEIPYREKGQKPFHGWSDIKEIGVGLIICKHFKLALKSEIGTICNPNALAKSF